VTGACHHRWCYEHSVWEGRKDRPSEVAVVRYCDICGDRQIAYANKWGKIPKHHDANHEIESSFPSRRISESIAHRYEE